MATRKVKTPRQRQQERKEQLQREQTVEKIISAMTETATRLQTVSAWAQWQNNAEAMTKGSHEATRSSSEQEMNHVAEAKPVSVYRLRWSLGTVLERCVVIGTSAEQIETAAD